MKVPKELWVRVGEFLEELENHYSVKSKPKVKVIPNSVVIEFEEYDVMYPEIQHLQEEFDNLQETDQYDVNTKEGFRFVLKTGEKQ